MALFRPYEQGKRDEKETPRTASTPKASEDANTPRSGGATAVGASSAAPNRRFGRRGGATAVIASPDTTTPQNTPTFQNTTTSETSTAGKPASGSTRGGATAVSASIPVERTQPAVRSQASSDTDESAQTRGPRVKQGPTPSRKEAERARMERLHPTLTAKEQKAQARANDRVARDRRFEAVENSPGRVLVRDYVDARWTIVEFMIPLMILVMACTMAATLFSPRLMYWLTFGMYAVFLAAIINMFILWRGFKRELAQRHPGTPTRGLLNYMINRAMWIRRFRRPAPRLNRGDSY